MIYDFEETNTIEGDVHKVRSRNFKLPRGWVALVTQRSNSSVPTEQIQVTATKRDGHVTLQYSSTTPSNGDVRLSHHQSGRSFNFKLPRHVVDKGVKTLQRVGRWAGKMGRGRNQQSPQ